MVGACYSPMALTRADLQRLLPGVTIASLVIITVTLLILPYLLFTNYYLDLAISLATAVIIIAVFNYYISVAKGESFRERFIEMAGLSLSVAAFSFVIGYFIRIWLGVEI